MDWKKFLSSEEFMEVGQRAIDHFELHGDSSFIARVLQPLSNQRTFKPLLLWFCDNAGLDYSFDGTKLQLKRAENSRTPVGQLTEYLQTHRGNAEDMGSKALRPATRQQDLAKLFAPEDGRRGGSPYLQGGAPGLGRRR